MNRCPSAFTLLELLLAMAITVIVAGTLAGSLYAAYRVKNAAERAIEVVRATSAAGDIFSRDLTYTLPATGILAGIFTGDIVSVSFYASGTEPRATTQGDCKLIEYGLIPATDGKSDQMLSRRVTTNLLAPTVTDAPDEQSCRNVTLFNLRYFDGTEWQDSLDSTQHNKLLRLGVEMTLELAAKLPGETPPPARCASSCCRAPNRIPPQPQRGAHNYGIRPSI